MSEDTIEHDTAKFKVFANGDTCWIIAKELPVSPGDFVPWVDAVQPISSTIELGRYDHCDCERYVNIGTRICMERRIYWSALGWEFDRFAKAYNGFGHQINAKGMEKCDGLHSFIYGGYSNGAALVAVALFAHMMKGKVTKEDYIQLVTFGSPRVLQKKVQQT